MSKRPDPLQTIQKLIQERYFDAKTVFWAGSVSQDKGTSASPKYTRIDFQIKYDGMSSQSKYRK